MITLRDLELGTCPPRLTRDEVAQLARVKPATLTDRVRRHAFPAPIARGERGISLWDAKDVALALGARAASRSNALTEEERAIINGLKV